MSILDKTVFGKVVELELIGELNKIEPDLFRHFSRIECLHFWVLFSKILSSRNRMDV